MNQMQQMLMRAQKMQKELEKEQAALAAKEFKASKSGMVEVTMLGSFEIKDIKIEKDALDPENKEMLEEAIRLAISEVTTKIAKEKDAIDEKVTGRTGGLF